MNTPCCPASSTSAVAATPSAAPLARSPRYTVENSPEAHTLRVDLPGVAKDAGTLKLEEGLLHLGGVGVLRVGDLVTQGQLPG